MFAYLLTNPRNSLSASTGKALDDAGVGVEKIVAGHTGLSGHSSGDHDDVASLESITELLVANVTSDLSCV